MTQWKVWFRNNSFGNELHDNVEFAIEFRVPQQAEHGPYPSNLVWEAAKVLADKLNLHMTGEVNNMDEV